MMNYGALGAICPLIGQHLAAIGFSGTQIGTITSMGTFAAIFAITFWGDKANASRNKDVILAFLCMTAACFSFVLMEIRVFIMFMMVYAVYYFFQQPISALSDAMTIGDGKPFNIVRMWGAIGYAVSVFVAGKLAKDDDLSIIFIISTVCFVLAAVDVYMIDKEKKLKNGITAEAAEIEKRYSRIEVDDADGFTNDRVKDLLDDYQELKIDNDLCIDEEPHIHTKAKKKNNTIYALNKDKKDETFRKATEKAAKRESRGRLINNKKYIKYLICVFFIGGTNIANNVYFGFLYKEAGGDVAGIGLAFLLMAGSEAPFMAICGRLGKKIGVEKLILISTLISVGRFAWYGTVPHWTLLIGLFFLQGMVNGILLVELVNYVAKVVDARDLSLAVSIYYVVSSSISAIVCQMIGGIILDIAGCSGVYFFCSIFNLIGAILYVTFGFCKKTNKSN